MGKREEILIEVGGRFAGAVDDFPINGFSPVRGRSPRRPLTFLFCFGFWLIGVVFCRRDPYLNFE